MRSLWKRQVNQTMLSKLNFKGTGSVFRFTLLQTFKAKANIVSLIFMMIFALVFPPVSAILNGGTRRQAQALEESLEQPSIALPGLTEEQNALLDGQYSSDSGSLTAFMDERNAAAAENPETAEEGPGFDERYFLQLAYAIIIIMVSIMSASYIIRSVVEEKSSKLVEYMLISVRPMALLTGKILAVLVYVVTLLLVMLGAYRLSDVLSARFLDVTTSNPMFDMLSRLTGVNPGEVVVIVISAILGILTFAILAGICGAGCSTTEDVNGANTMPMIIIMACYVIALMVSGFDSPGMNIFCSLCPILSVFCAPVQFMLGNIGWPMQLLAWVIQCGVILLLLAITSKVYSDLLIYRGTRLKFGDILKMAFAGKGGSRS